MGLPSKSCRKKISPVLMTEEFSEVLKIITFLQMIHVSLKKVGSTVEAKMSICELKNLYPWECIQGSPWIWNYTEYVLFGCCVNIVQLLYYTGTNSLQGYP